jgi:polysaccharide biosynthesis/export protein
MFKWLFFPIALILCVAHPNVLFAQAEVPAAVKLTNHVREREDTLTQPTVSPTAAAEAKRLYKQGVKYGLAGLYTQAAQTFQLALKLDPGYADAYFGLGHAYFDMRQWQKAIDSFERVIELNPKDDEARERLNNAREMLQKDAVVTPTESITSSSSQAAGMQVSMAAKTTPAPAKSNGRAIETNTLSNEIALTKVYRVGPGDVLDVRLNAAAPPSSTLFTVTPSGFLEHPLLAEPLRVNGFTVEEISSKIENELRRRALVDNPKAVVGVRDYASHTILVSGLVKDSGTKILRREAIPLYVVIADAQPLPEAATVTIVRTESNQAFNIELSQSNEMNLLIRPGDVITLHAHAMQFVYIGGEVKLPGEKTYRRGLTLTQAIIAAGGLTPKSREARLGRDDGKGFLVVTKFKLKDIESGKVPDPLVKAGDRITIY